MEMGIVRGIRSHPGNGIIASIGFVQNFAEGILISEIPSGRGRGYDHAKRPGQGGFWISLDQGECKHFEEIRVGIQIFRFVKAFVFIPYNTPHS